MKKVFVLAMGLLICSFAISGCALKPETPSIGQPVDFFQILPFILVGFLAQIIDGSLGMAYGVSSNSFLLSLGLPPATASASVHTAEVVTTGISGLSHWKLRNIDTKLAKQLIIPGVIGGVSGAYLLTNINGDALKPYISIYLLIMGIVIIAKAFRKQKSPDQPPKHIQILGLIGGFMDAIGGGGWGPVVTSTLVARGHNPRVMIGTVNFSEFFVTFAQSIAFLLMLNYTDHWYIIAGLLIGGAIAAPMAAILARKVKPKILMILVGSLIILLSIRTLFLT